MASRPFAIVGVNSDSNLEELHVRLEKEKITWPSFWCGEEGTRGAIPSLWNVSGWPTIYFIDHDGVIRETSVGSPDDMDAIVDRLVAEAEEAAKTSQ